MLGDSHPALANDTSWRQVVVWTNERQLVVEIKKDVEMACTQHNNNMHAIGGLLE